MFIIYITFEKTYSISKNRIIEQKIILLKQKKENIQYYTVFFRILYYLFLFFFSIIKIDLGYIEIFVFVQNVFIFSCEARYCVINQLLNNRCKNHSISTWELTPKQIFFVWKY